MGKFSDWPGSQWWRWDSVIYIISKESVWLETTLVGISVTIQDCWVWSLVGSIWRGHSSTFMQWSEGGAPGWWSSSDVATFDRHSQALSHQVVNPWLREHAQRSQGARCVSGRKSWSGIPIVVTSVTSISPRQPTPSHLLSLPTGMVNSPWESSVQLESSHSTSHHSTEGWCCHFHFIDYKAELSGHLMAEPRFKAHAVRPVWINTDHTVKFEFPMNSK